MPLLSAFFEFLALGPLFSSLFLICSWCLLSCTTKKTYSLLLSSWYAFCCTTFLFAVFLSFHSKIFFICPRFSRLLLLFFLVFFHQQTALFSAITMHRVLLVLHVIFWFLIISLFLCLICCCISLLASTSTLFSFTVSSFVCGFASEMSFHPRDDDTEAPKAKVNQHIEFAVAGSHSAFSFAIIWYVQVRLYIQQRSNFPFVTDNDLQKWIRDGRAWFEDVCGFFAALSYNLHASPSCLLCTFRHFFLCCEVSELNFFLNLL